MVSSLLQARAFYCWSYGNNGGGGCHSPGQVVAGASALQFADGGRRTGPEQVGGTLQLLVSDKIGDGQIQISFVKRKLLGPSGLQFRTLELNTRQ